MRRFFVETATPEAGLLSITGKEARHMVRVLRMKKGDVVVIINGKGHSFESTIESLHPKEVTVRINKTLPSLPQPPVTLNLAQALLKSGPMDYLIQKVVELGVTSLSLFHSERTVITVQSDHLNKRMARWKEIMKSACKQCGRPTLPDLHSPQPFSEILRARTTESTLKIVLWEHEQAKDLKHVFRSVNPLPRVMAVVGPEGGFSQNEISMARKSGYSIVSLGKRILRAETAALSLVSIIQYEWGDLNLG